MNRIENGMYTINGLSTEAHKSFPHKIFSCMHSNNSNSIFILFILESVLNLCEVHDISFLFILCKKIYVHPNNCYTKTFTPLSLKLIHIFYFKLEKFLSFQTGRNGNSWPLTKNLRNSCNLMKNVEVTCAFFFIH